MCYDSVENGVLIYFILPPNYVLNTKKYKWHDGQRRLVIYSLVLFNISAVYVCLTTRRVCILLATWAARFCGRHWLVARRLIGWLFIRDLEEWRDGRTSKPTCKRAGVHI